jgi:hypothetical protein
VPDADPREQNAFPAGQPPPDETDVSVRMLVEACSWP